MQKGGAKRKIICVVNVWLRCLWTWVLISVNNVFFSNMDGQSSESLLVKSKRSFCEPCETLKRHREHSWKVKSMQLRSLLTMNYISHVARLLPETQATTTRFQGERLLEALPGRTASYKTCVSQRLFFTLQSLWHLMRFKDAPWKDHFLIYLYFMLVWRRDVE